MDYQLWEISVDVMALLNNDKLLKLPVDEFVNNLYLEFENQSKSVMIID